MSTPAGPARRGSRDPQMRQRLQRDEGVVARVTDEPDQGEPEMYPEAQIDLTTEGEGDVENFVVLLAPGDIVAAKTSVQGKDISGDEVWHSLGVQTRVQPDEDPEDAMNRASYLANQGVLDLAEDFEARQQALLAERRQRPIRPSR